MQTMKSYTLTPEETEIYDSGDDTATFLLRMELMRRFRGTDTEIYHPFGFVVAIY